MSRQILKQNLSKIENANNVTEIIAFEGDKEQPVRIPINELLYPTGTKVYIAAINQSSTAAPVATIFRNDFDSDIVYSRDATGRYTGTLTGAFTEGKSFIYLSRSGDDGNLAAGNAHTKLTSGFNDANSFYLSSATVANDTGVVTASDGYFYRTLIRIEVYE